MNNKKKVLYLPEKNQNLIDEDVEYININELSKMLDISVSHIYTLTSQKKIPHIKLLGKKLLFSKKEIQNWVSTKSVLSS
jgi:excisionase family DNA binding protein